MGGRPKNLLKPLPAELLEPLRLSVGRIVALIEPHGHFKFLETMSEYLGDPRNFTDCRELMKQLSLSPSDVIDPLNYRDGGKSGPIRNPISEKTLDRFINKEVETSNIYVNSLYLYVKLEYEHIFDEIYKETVVYNREQFPKELRRVFRHHADMKVADVSFYAGEYSLYHPFQLDPAKSVVVSKLFIGDSKGFGGPFDCSLQYAFNDGIETVKQKFEGKLAKHGDSASFYLADERNSHFIFYVDYTSGQGRAKRMEGIFIANVHGSERASAWPFYAEKVGADALCEPGVIPWSETPHRALRHFRRGAVHWDEEYFQAPSIAR